MQYVISSEIVNVLKKGKTFSQADAFLDILSRIGKDGAAEYSERDFMRRWGWSNTKVRNFVFLLEEKSIIKAEKNQKKSRLLLINQGFVGHAEIKKKSEKTQEKSTCFHTTITLNEAVKTIAEAWNGLSAYGICPITEDELSHSQYQNIKNIAKEHGVEDMLRTINRIKNSDFLQGKGGGGWKITFNWFIRNENYEKVRSGEYDGARESDGRQSKTAQMLENHYDMVSEWARKKKMKEEVNDG